MEDAVEEILLEGFDPAGEPSIRRTAAGRLWLGFEFMPPSWAPDELRIDLGPWADFDKQLERAIGVPVLWDDREWFLIERPQPDTISAVLQFLLELRHRLDQGAP